MTKKELQKTVKKLVGLSFKDGKLLENQVVKSIKVLKTLSRVDAIKALSEYVKSLKRKEREHTMLIETTISLSTLQIQKIKKIVEKKIKITKVLININPEILGGFMIKIGDEVWDETVRNKIDQVKEVIRG